MPDSVNCDHVERSKLKKLYDMLKKLHVKSMHLNLVESQPKAVRELHYTAMEQNIAWSNAQSLKLSRLENQVATASHCGGK
ncbi:uncharacterized protein MEPE_04063 [Melanopsichium pennsylvanicum]|uniref:Uncharacterized protein n=1 Tax=Melanopsichium pennsylvanicum TaxID=63383 RepID=A0AAJ4XN18_9BASI|nr:uncharacterized protein MEPE_04063 [Melanopsichium pennsylvanicum]